jgi:hypothetical protein
VVKVKGFFKSMNASDTVICESEVIRARTRKAALARWGVRTMAARFWSKVENSSGADCWQWLDAGRGGGYGAFGIKRNGKHITVDAHRIAWELSYGPVPEGMFVCHRCDNPGCVNPGHLFVDTHNGNMEDMVSKGRQASGERHGRHELTLDDIPLVRLFSAAGASQRFIAKRFNVGQTTVGNVVYGRTWRENSDERNAMEEYWVAMFVAPLA